MAKQAKPAAKKAAPKKVDKVDFLKEIENASSALNLSFSVLAEDMEKFKEGNTSAGRRMRKALQEMRKSAQVTRKAIMGQIKVFKAKK